MSAVQWDMACHDAVKAEQQQLADIAKEKVSVSIHRMTSGKTAQKDGMAEESWKIFAAIPYSAD